MNAKEILITLRNIFAYCFLIGFVFLVIAAKIYMPCDCYVANLYITGIGITPDNYYNLWVGFVGLIKTILVFIFLTPTIAIQIAILNYNKAHKENQN